VVLAQELLLQQQVQMLIFRKLFLVIIHTEAVVLVGQFQCLEKEIGLVVIQPVGVVLRNIAFQ
jgi:hypothetical protein